MFTRRPLTSGALEVRSAAMDAPTAEGAVLEIGRQVRLCMTELRDLRSELAAEREGRGQSATHVAKRIRDEVLVEMHSMQLNTQRDMRELDAKVTARFEDASRQRTADRKQVDDACRLVKAADRAQFDVSEVYREAMQEMRGKVEAAAAEAQAVRLETTQQLEREKGSMQRRLETELMRIADIQRAMQDSIAEIKSSIVRELSHASKDIERFVDLAWQRHFGGVNKMIAEGAERQRSLSERQSTALTELEEKIASTTRSLRHDIHSNVTAIQERVSAHDNAVALLGTKMDRCERTATSAIDTVSRSAAQVDAMRDVSERAAAIGQRALERAQRVEEALGERDARLLHVESATNALGGLERVRVDVEAMQHAISRVESKLESVKEIADRDERAVETMQRDIDLAVERAEAVEKKSHRAISKVEAAEQRLVRFVERIVSLEETNEKSLTNAAHLGTTCDGLTQKLSATETRQRQLQEKVDAMLHDVMERLSSVEVSQDQSKEIASKAEVATTLMRGTTERLDKKVTKADVSVANALDNLRETRELVDTQNKDVVALRRRLEILKETSDRIEQRFEQRLVEMESSKLRQPGTSGSTVDRSAVIQLEDRIQAISDSVNRLSRREPERGVDCTPDIQRLQRQVGDCENRIQDVERRLSQVSQQASTQRNDVGALQHSVSAMDASVSASLRQVAALDLRLRTTEAALTTPPLSTHAPPRPATPTYTPPPSVPSTPPPAVGVSKVPAMVPTLLGEPYSPPTVMALPARKEIPPPSPRGSSDASPNFTRTYTETFAERSMSQSTAEMKTTRVEGAVPHIARVAETPQAPKPSTIDFDESDESVEEVVDRKVEQKVEQKVAALPSLGTPPPAAPALPLGKPPLDQLRPPPQSTPAPAPRKAKEGTPYSDTSESDERTPLPTAVAPVRLASKFDDEEDDELPPKAAGGVRVVSKVVPSTSPAVSPSVKREKDSSSSNDSFDLPASAPRSTSPRHKYRFVSEGSSSAAEGPRQDVATKKLTKRPSSQHAPSQHAPSAATDSDDEPRQRATKSPSMRSRGSRRSAPSKKSTNVSLSLESGSSKSGKARSEVDAALAEALGF